MDILWLLGRVWTEVFIRPMVNALLLLDFFVGNFGITIIVFTIVIRLLMFPLTLRQMRISKGMSALQPEIRRLQQRFGQDRQRLQQETTKLYREAGVNPLGCAGPMVAQMPIFIALFYALYAVMPAGPEGLLALTQHLYSWLPPVFARVPVERHFLWFDLALSDPFPPYQGALLPILVGFTMWLQQRVTPTPVTTPEQASMNRMMTIVMPLLFGYMTFFFPAGLAVYWTASNAIGIAMQSAYSLWGPQIAAKAEAPPAKEIPPPPVPIAKPREPTAEETRSKSRQRKRTTDARDRSKRKKRR